MDKQNIVVFIMQGVDSYFVKGAVDRVLQLCSRYSYRGADLPLNSKMAQEFLGQASEMGRTGLRGEWMQRNVSPDLLDHLVYYISVFRIEMVQVVEILPLAGIILGMALANVRCCNVTSYGITRPHSLCKMNIYIYKLCD